MSSTVSDALFNESYNTTVEEGAEKKFNQEYVRNLFERAIQQDAKTEEVSSVVSPPENLMSLANASEQDLQLWEQEGMRAISQGKVAVVILAGGQGTRLGFDGPKGMYNIGLPSGKSLFQMFAERIVRLCCLSDKKFNLKDESSAIPLFIMTSPLNDSSTRSFLEECNFFGLNPSNVHFFVQGTLPCLSLDGTILMASENVVSLAPDGNGGVYTALKKSGSLSSMMNRGIAYLHVCSVDNVLACPADPAFIGACLATKSDIGSQCVWKRDASEKVGVAACRDGLPCIIEYTEIPTELRGKCDSNGRLVYGAGNICNHFYTLDFITNIAIPALESGEVAYHVARKKIPCVQRDEISNKMVETIVDGIKLESFIFDVFPLSKKMTVVEVLREESFSPVKNAPGALQGDSPDTARKALSDQAICWAEKAGAILCTSGSSQDDVCEISPLVSVKGEGLESLLGTELQVPFYIEKGADGLTLMK